MSPAGEAVVPDRSLTAAVSCPARFITNVRESSGLLRLDLELSQPVPFRPGQFAMLNLAGSMPLVFSRPFSILGVQDCTMSILYRVVGRGTQAFSELRPGQEMSMLGPLGRPFPGPEALVATPAVLLAGGVGLPPLHNWLTRYGRPGDIGFFGGRDGADVPWDLLGGRWQVSVDSPVDLPPGQQAWPGRVTDFAAAHPLLVGDQRRVVLACGPVPLLKAAVRLAAARGWDCHVSLEEHMGCGYGVCKGCVVPVHDQGPDGWRNATCCQEGPVFAADEIRWDRYGGDGSAPAAGGPACR
jgi:dihydroorotate dehydrogenase electron transfer subunit